MRSQITLGQIARECVGQPDGTTLVRSASRAGRFWASADRAGRYDVPVHIVVKDGSTVFANRSRRVAAAIPAGETQATFSVIEEGIVVPAADANSFEIEVGLGSGAPRRRRRAVARLDLHARAAAARPLAGRRGDGEDLVDPALVQVDDLEAPARWSPHARPWSGRCCNSLITSPPTVW